MSEATDAYLAELEAAELQSAGVLEDAEARGGEDLNGRASAALRRTRKILNQHKVAMERLRQEVAAEARQELVRERQTESNFRRLGVPPSARALFSDLDVTDWSVMRERADELAAAGVTWPGQPQPPAPPPPDPNLVAQQQMQQAAHGGGTPGSAGDLATRLRKQAADPGRYTDAERDRTVDDYNRAVDAAARKQGAGALG